MLHLEDCVMVWVVWGDRLLRDRRVRHGTWASEYWGSKWKRALGLGGGK